jgi:hypothetical protein
MFWKVLGGVMRGSIMINRTFTALGAATIITIGVYDYIQARKRRNNGYPPRLP